MHRNILAGLMVVAMCTGVAPVLADEDEPLCLQCHEPAEDWQGMSGADIFAATRDPDNKRHRDIQALSDEQLKAVIQILAPE